MAMNPQKRQGMLDNPIDRSNLVNDPDYAHQEGYNPFALTSPGLFTLRYGEVTPTSVFDTVSGDRHLMSEGVKVFLDEVQNRVMSDINTYVDYFNVPYRSIFPINWDKIIVHPNRGSDVPFGALPQIPFLHLMRNLLNATLDITVRPIGVNEVLSLDTSDRGWTFESFSYSSLFNGEEDTPYLSDIYLSNIQFVRLLYFCFIMSRGQLLDNLNYALENISDDIYGINTRYGYQKNNFQQRIDDFFEILARAAIANKFSLVGIDLSFNSNDDEFNLMNNFYDFALVDNYSQQNGVKLRYMPDAEGEWSLSDFRAALYDCFERGLYPLIYAKDYENRGYSIPYVLTNDAVSILEYFEGYLFQFQTPDLTVTEFDNFFDAGYMNPARIVAYQQSVAEYFSNDTVDSVFTSELWMQNIRSLMYPSVDMLGTEPTFRYNGIDTEYDMFTTGGFVRAWFSSWSLLNGYLTRLLPFLSNVFIQRRSIRFRDYFASARTRMLAVGDLRIPVQSDGTISPIDTTKGIMFQRFFNAVNRWTRKVKNYMASLFGVVPTVNECSPSWICRRVNAMQSDTIAKTSGDDQGKVSTNLVSTTSDFIFDIFIDDFSVVLGVTSFDIQPYYSSGVDRSYRHIDRFSMFNPMLQNIGDQEIRTDELTGDVKLFPDNPFGYVTRYGEYKVGVPRAHGGFVNNIPARVFIYPVKTMSQYSGDKVTWRIDSDFIRDAPYFLDLFKPALTSLSPAQYYHFTASVNNPHNSSRKISMWPGIL